MDEVFNTLHKTYPGTFQRDFAPTSDARLKNQGHWFRTFRDAGLSPREVSTALKGIAKGERLLDKQGNKPNMSYAPALPEFIELAKPGGGLGHASRRPVDKVLLEQTGALAHRLPPETAEGKSRRKTVGNAALAALKAGF